MVPRFLTKLSARGSVISRLDERMSPTENHFGPRDVVELVVVTRVAYFGHCRVMLSDVDEKKRATQRCLADVCRTTVLMGPKALRSTLLQLYAPQKRSHLLGRIPPSLGKLADCEL